MFKDNKHETVTEELGIKIPLPLNMELAYELCAKKSQFTSEKEETKKCYP